MKILLRHVSVYLTQKESFLDLICFVEKIEGHQF